MPRYVIFEMRKDLYYVYSEGEVLFKTNSKELAIAKVNQLESIDLMHEMMTTY